VSPKAPICEEYASLDLPFFNLFVLDEFKWKRPPLESRPFLSLDNGES
jgi:hypothetical protein